MELTTVWFILIAVLWTGYFFLEGFDFGVGILTKVIPAKGDERERRVLINTIGPVWDGNEVWMITAAGALFAAFPEWYATFFSGFYLLLLLILISLILRAVAFEYRVKKDNERWKRNWEHAIFWGSAVPAFLWGLIFANLVRGVPIDAEKEFVGNLADLFSPYAILGGLVTLALFTFHGAAFVALKTVGDVRDKANTLIARLGWVVLLLVAGFLIWTQVSYGNTKSFVALVVALVVLVGAQALNRIRREGWVFVYSGVAVVALVAMWFLTMFPNVMPSTIDAAFNLTKDNAAATPYTLKIITWVAAFMTPIVLLYQGWTYWVFRKRIGVQNIPTAVPHGAGKLD